MYMHAKSKCVVDFKEGGARVVVRAGDSLLLLRNGVLTCELHAPESKLGRGVTLDDSMFELDGPLSLGKEFQFVYQRGVGDTTYFALCVVSAASDRAGLLLADSDRGVLLGASIPVVEVAAIFRNKDSAFSYLFEAYASALVPQETTH